MEPCIDGLCGIFNHRSTALLTPLVSITSSGELARSFSTDTAVLFQVYLPISSMKALLDMHNTVV